MLQNGACWRDTDGNLLQAHGGSLLFHEGLWYWYGENKNSGTTHDKTGWHVPFGGFCCYTSADLLQWQSAGVVLAPGEGLGADIVGERPSVLHNPATGKFVLWFHYDDRQYLTAKAGVAVASSPTGPFRFLRAVRPNGRESRDMTLFADEDGTACLLCCADGNSTLLVHRLDDAYTGLTGEFTTCFAGQYREAPVVVKQAGLYYMFTSGCSGWAPNPMLYATSTAMLGGWMLWNNPCAGPRAATSYDGQPACAFAAGGKQYLVLDHWKREDLRSSGYSILPLKIEGREASLLFKEYWKGIE